MNFLKKAAKSGQEELIKQGKEKLQEEANEHLGTEGVSLLKKSASFVKLNENGAPTLDTAKLAEEGKS